MKQWYELTNELETVVPELDPCALQRIGKAVRPRKRRWKLAVILAAVFLTACGCVAARYAGWFWHMAENPRQPEESEDLLASMGTVIDQTRTVDGVTVTLHGALWDGHNLLLSLSMEGAGIPQPQTGSVSAEGSWLYYSRAQYEKNLQALAHLPYFTQAAMEAHLALYDQMAPSREIRLEGVHDHRTQTNLYTIQTQFTADRAETELVLNLDNLGENRAGPFAYTFTIRQNDAALVYTGDAALTPQITVTEVAVTPLETRVTCTGRGEPEDLELEVCIGDETIYFRGSGAQTEYGDDGTWTCVLRQGPSDRVYDPKAVTAISINGIRLELSDFQ